jgi:hypothetical protein
LGASLLVSLGQLPRLVLLEIDIAVTRELHGDSESIFQLDSLQVLAVRFKFLKKLVYESCVCLFILS